ncbi:MAG: transglycosylase SLT domain-containing protein [Bdellovibrionales bacterium]|nr:transglycosylase SLT domain-containing protein [Bdellovibrionales bacterium]
MTGSEFKTDSHNARLSCGLVSALLIMTFVLATGCTTTRYSTSTVKLEAPAKPMKAKRKMRKAAGNKTAEQKLIAVEAVEPAPAPSASIAKPEAKPEDKLDNDNETEAPTTEPSSREAAAYAPKTPGRFRTLSPEVPVSATTDVPTGLKAADEIIKKTKVNEAHLIFDFPVTYNARVRKWIRYFQTTGRSSFRRWLERSTRYIPYIHSELKRAGLPTDIAYVAMIESGFSSSAVSHANAMGMWQFIAPTGERYGLNVDWWIDERRDYEKATKAAIGYMSDLFDQFGSWYLVAASYNMGEGGVRRLIKRHKTNSFWDLADRGALPEETRNYVPKMLAAMLIAKAPALYGFRDLEFHVPFAFEFYNAPGGTDLINLANHLGVSERSLTELNPELLKGFIPRDIKSHRIRIPKGSRSAVAMYLNQSETVTQ